jgi:hypothetical protein
MGFFYPFLAKNIAPGLYNGLLMPGKTNALFVGCIAGGFNIIKPRLPFIRGRKKDYFYGVKPQKWK